MLARTALPSSRQSHPQTAAERAAPADVEIRAGTAWWLWPHVLSLDAPLVALVWQHWWAQALRVGLPWHQPCVLGLGVWMIYLADRLADAARAAPGEPVTRRHAFHHRWRAALTVLAALAAAALTLSTPWILPRKTFLDGLLLLTLAGAYFWSIHVARAQGWTRLLPKEAAVGGMFAIGSFFFPWSQGAANQISVLASVALFGALCFCNCALITVWERHAQDVRDPASLLNAFPGLSTHLRALCLALACVAGGGCVLARSAVFLPLVCGGVCLALLDYAGRRIPADALRALADAALLTPLLASAFCQP